MELNWSTFVFEIINFLILVWILQRFLYKPVLAVIARRREGIEKTLADATALQHEAEALQAKYQNRLSGWEQEKQAAREALGRDLEAERARRLEALRQSLDQEREKAHVVEERRVQEALRLNEARALEQAARFGASILQRVASPALDKQLADLVLEELARLPSEQVRMLRAACEDVDQPALITSAYELDTERQAALRSALTTLTGSGISCTFRQDIALIAGLRITIGPWNLQANLQDELKYFAEAANGA